MTTFLLIRHALNDTVGRRVAGWQAGIRLNGEGRGQAERLSSRLSVAPLAAVYSSPLERALETAGAVARAHRLEFRSADEFGEMRFGEWTGRSFRELDEDPLWRQFNTFRSGTRPPGGETMLEVQARMLAGLERLCERHPDKTVAVVSHGDPIKSVIAHFAGMPLDFFLRLEVSPASVSVVSVGMYGPQILLVNDTGELPELKSKGV
jgi:probable phosphoglycerate mutase